MDKSSSSVTVLLFLMGFPIFGHALFEYICEEKQLYQPYVHIYKSRKGERIIDVGPGFHDLTEMMNVYVCINGVAYLYFSKTTEFGEVFETPRLKMYAHSCEMYNVQPKEGSASVMEVQLHLTAILLLGDPNDYRRPSIQKFTAPYYFKKDQLNNRNSTHPEYVLMPSLHLNASSLVIIGQSECTLLKGNNRNTLIKVRPHLFAPDAGAKVEEGHLCKIGFQPLLEKASTSGNTVPPDVDRAPALALINDEAIRVERCQGSQSVDMADSTQNFNIMTSEIDELDNDYNKQTDQYLEKYNKLVDAVLTPLNEEKTKLEAKKNDSDTKPKDVKKIEKLLTKLNARIKLEEVKQASFGKALADLSEEIATLTTIRTEAQPDGAKGSAAKTDKESADTAEAEWEKIREQKPPATQSDIDEKKKAFEEAKKKAQDSARDFLWAMSDLELGLLKLKKTVEKVKRLSVYTPSSSHGKSSSQSKGKRGAVNFNPDGTTSVVIKSEEKNCEKLPVLEGAEGECQKGKPDKERTCNLFKTTLGVVDPWTAREDAWKKEILDLIANVFSTVCDRIFNVKKFTGLANRVMAYYLTNDAIFNLKPNLTTDTCLNFKMANNLKIVGASSQANLSYKEESQFWNTVRLALNDCNRGARRLSFKEKASGKYQFVRNAGTSEEELLDVLRHEEQADAEFSYNWAIDMNWKIFVTVMGFCMPEYEKKIPLITSRFFSLYTEYFLIPLRDEWVNPKDNIIFQFIMGEFYNEHTELWADICMEASFIYAGQQDYRPPRSLLVNCASEHNYFVK